MTRDEVIERARQLIDDEVLTRTGRSVGDLASGHVARAMADAGLLADPGQHSELEKAIQHRDSLARRCAKRFENEQRLATARDALQARLDAVSKTCDAAEIVVKIGAAENPARWETAQAAIADVRAALQGDQPTELPSCVCKPDCCLGEDGPLNACEHCATIDGELPCPVADAEPTGEACRG